MHVLLEGVPGLAKTLSVSTLSKAIKADFKRVQFKPFPKLIYDCLAQFATSPDSTLVVL